MTINYIAVSVERSGGEVAGCRWLVRTGGGRNSQTGRSSGAVEPWTRGAVEQWSSGRLQVAGAHWRREELTDGAEQWSSGAVEQWSRGAVEQWNSGAMEQWNSGAVEQWSRGAVEPWSRGAVEPWSSGRLQVAGAHWRRGDHTDGFTTVHLQQCAFPERAL